jgi:hypothetical protein
MRDTGPNPAAKLKFAFYYKRLPANAVNWLMLGRFRRYFIVFAELTDAKKMRGHGVAGGLHEP